MMDIGKLVDVVEEGKGCKGLIYKARVNCFIDSKGNFVQKISMVLQKRKSCPGCPKCGYLLENLSEAIALKTDDFNISDAEHNEFYTLMAINIHRDRESGIVDDWDLEFIKI
jgi:hypothetical protein